MDETSQTYVFRTSEGGWRLTGSRVSLDSVLHAYWDGYTPEDIVAQFPSLSAEQVYGAIAFYLHHRSEIDAYLATQEQKWNKFREQSEKDNAPLLRRLRAAREAVTQKGRSA